LSAGNVAARKRSERDIDAAGGGLNAAGWVKGVIAEWRGVLVCCCVGEREREGRRRTRGEGRGRRG